MTSIPVTVFTGFLGAGKTTIVLSVLDQIKPGYKVVVLKNEFGDVEVDSKLMLAKAAASEDSKDSGDKKESFVNVTEMLNGCLCCVLVGQMKNALLDIKEKYSPDRIIVETSGSAFPAPIAWQIRQLNPDGFVLDAIITVIDCVNFTGYEDTSYTAKMQAKYTDLILLNKHELSTLSNMKTKISERQFDILLDHVYELNEDTPKLKCNGTRGVSLDLLFGIDTKLFQLESAISEKNEQDLHHQENEVDLVRIMFPPPVAGHDHRCTDENVCKHDQGVDGVDLEFPCLFTVQSLESFLKTLPVDVFYRIKGLVRVQSTDDDTASLWILNWAVGRHTLTQISSNGNDDTKREVYRVTVMGVGLGGWPGRLAKAFGFGKEGESEAVIEQKLIAARVVKFTPSGR
ncbi:hypothetical protein HDU82_009114 [Entophlyctis luteolus]|nr:hypothetical protein HDU82_009114 [Entophlyctis luteolus]